MQIPAQHFRLRHGLKDHVIKACEPFPSVPQHRADRFRAHTANRQNIDGLVLKHGQTVSQQELAPAGYAVFLRVFSAVCKRPSPDIGNISFPDDTFRQQTDRQVGVIRTDICKDVAGLKLFLYRGKPNVKQWVFHEL
jgi:hypothetical protein